MRQPGLTVQAGEAHLTIIFFLWVVPLWPVSATPDDRAAMPHVGVLVRNLCQAPAETVQRAEAACDKMFQAAGIRVTWINRVDDISWQGPDVVLRGAIVPRAPASRGIEVFGTAFLLKSEGSQMLIYYDRVVGLSRLANLPVDVVLSGALAHEIGHLLLRSPKHSVGGVMRGEWGMRELNAQGQGLLGFTRQQKLQMKVYLIAARQSAVTQDRNTPRR
jgi:hypothetical protein